ncbi:unnamed protein product [Nyctereutes procyonoides]|uniref:(raccoon dog) hypothetical protein n=1 Tax=Nyctereutes procyonoides TaxID=34880 RepID=A0A811Z8K4_NYCPR|nr:unnamed protein product [Nyctereutes procyonoides]
MHVQTPSSTRCLHSCPRISVLTATSMEAPMWRRRRIQAPLTIQPLTTFAFSLGRFLRLAGSKPLVGRRGASVPTQHGPPPGEPTGRGAQCPGQEGTGVCLRDHARSQRPRGQCEVCGVGRPHARAALVGAFPARGGTPPHGPTPHPCFSFQTPQTTDTPTPSLHTHQEVHSQQVANKVGSTVTILSIILGRCPQLPHVISI